MPTTQFTPHQFMLDIWRTDVRGSDFALVTVGSATEPVDNAVLDAPDVFQQRHMVHCSALGFALDNEELDGRLVSSGGGGSSECELRLRAQRWPPPQEDTLLADLDADVLQCMQPAAREDRPSFVWLSAMPDEADAASLGSNLRGFLGQLLERAAVALPAQAAAIEAFACGDALAHAHSTLRHPSWPSDHELAFELAATHSAAAAGSSPPFAGDSPGGPLQLEMGLAAVIERYAAARGCPLDQVELTVLGTRQFREKRQHALAVCTAGDGGLAHVFGTPLQPVQQYNLQQQQEGAEVVAQPDSDGHGLTWWLQSSMAPVAPDQELTLPWKTFVNLDPAAKGAAAITVAAYSLGNDKYDALDLALYFPEPGAELQVPVSHARLRRADALRPCRTGSVPRAEEARVPSAGAVGRLARAGISLLAAPELVRWLREAGMQELLRAIEAAGGIRKASPRKEASPAPVPVPAPLLAEAGI